MKARLQKDQGHQRMPVPNIGMIKIGERNDKGFPVSLDYFKPTSSHQHYVDVFHQILGERPTSLNIVFVSDSPGDSCRELLELRDASGKVFAKSDGIDFDIAENGEYKRYRPEYYLQKHGSKDLFMEKILAASVSKKGWVRQLTLKFIITDIKSVLGTWTLTTYADKSSIDQIISTFDQMLENAGKVAMIPFDLTVRKVTSDVSGSNRKYPVLTLVPNISAENIHRIKDMGNINGMITNQLIEGSDFKEEV